jgi:hypothetical protein
MTTVNIFISFWQKKVIRSHCLLFHFSLNKQLIHVFHQCNEHKQCRLNFISFLFHYLLLDNLTKYLTDNTSNLTIYENMKRENSFLSFIIDWSCLDWNNQRLWYIIKLHTFLWGHWIIEKTLPYMAIDPVSHIG